MKTGTLHELLKLVEKKTGQSTSFHHELTCRDGKMVSDFYFFLGSTCEGMFSTWEEAFEKMRSYL